MRPHIAWRVLAAYLAVTAPAALGAPRLLGALHLALLVAACALGWARRRVQPVEAPAWLDWGPLVVMSLLYAELPLLMAGAAAGHGGTVVYHDVAVQRWEAAAFGTSPAISLAGRLPVAVAGLLHGAYLAYYALIFLPPLVLFARRAGAEFRTTVLGLTTAFAICFVVFVYFPVQGPRYLWAEPPGMPHSIVRELALRVLRAGSSRGAAFPSSHVAVAVTQAALALRYQRRVGLATAFCAGLLALGAVYGGFHYGVDVLAGAGVGLAVSAVVLVYARALRRVLSMSDAPALAVHGGAGA